MKKWMRALASTALACSMLATMLPLGAMAQPDQTVPVTQAQVLKHGRTYEKGGALCLDWSNSGITFNFTGTGAKLDMVGSSANPNPAYVNVYVDGALAPTSTIQVGTTKQSYVLAQGLELGDHTISVRKRNEAVYGGSATLTLSDLTITEGELTEAPKMAERRIEVIGDSITAGFGNLAANTTVGYSSHVSDGTSTYATLTAQALGAEIDVIARSGIRFVRADANNSMFPAYDKVSGLENKCTDAYDFEANPKDVVIINLGTNDNGATLNGETVTDEYVQSEAKAFLKLVREKNPNAEIVWAYGIMGSGRADAIQAAIDEMNDEHITFYSLDKINPNKEGYGSDNHPTVTTAINRSFDLTEYIAGKMGWSDYNYNAQLAQELRVAEKYDDDYLKLYTKASVDDLKEKIDAASKLTDPTNDRIKEAVEAIQTAHQNLAVDMTEAASISGEEAKTATTHYMQVNVPTDADLTQKLDGKWYLTYEVKVDPVGVEPTDTKWKSYIQNGRAYLTNEDGQETEIAQGLSLAGMSFDEDGYAKVTVEVPDSFRETATDIKNFRLFYYNDTEHAPEADRGGVTWEKENSNVQLSIRNVKLMATVADFISTAGLKKAVAEAKTDLSDYEDGEAKTAYEDALSKAKTALNATTQLEINQALKALKTAESALVLKSETVVILLDGEKTTKEDHYLSVDNNLQTPLDLSLYKPGELMLSYQIRINTTENHPDVDAVGWINNINAGRMGLFSVDPTEANINQNGVYVGGDANGVLACGQNELAGIQPNEWKPVTVPVPDKMFDSDHGRITKFHMYIYNNLDKFNETWSNKLGVTVSLQNVKITKAVSDTPSVDKTELKTLLDGQQDRETLLKTYTEASVNAYEALFTEAKTVYDNADATEEQVKEQVDLLKNADSKLVSKLAFQYGNVNGDDKVDIIDALITLQYTAEQIDLTNEQLTAADVDGKAGVTASDALVILKYATRQISSLPLASTTPDPDNNSDEGLGGGDGANDTMP